MKDLIIKLAAGQKINKVGNKKNTLTGDVVDILNIVIGVLGLVCVVVMIIGGINYMTSSGDAGKVKKAKDTILYGLIGLVVSALSFALVNWVIADVLNQGASTDDDKDDETSLIIQADNLNS